MLHGSVKHAPFSTNEQLQICYSKWWRVAPLWWEQRAWIGKIMHGNEPIKLQHFTLSGHDFLQPC